MVEVFTAIHFTAIMAFTFAAPPKPGRRHRREDETHLRSRRPPTTTNLHLDDFGHPGPTPRTGPTNHASSRPQRRAPAALLIETVAPTAGQADASNLIVAIRADGGVSGVRRSPAPTPGPATTSTRRRTRTRNPWIAQFAELKAADMPGCKVQGRRPDRLTPARHHQRRAVTKCRGRAAHLRRRQPPIWLVRVEKRQ